MTFAELLRDKMAGRDAVPSALEELVDDGDIYIVEDELVDVGRWEVQHRAIIRHNDQHWAVIYSEPATEYQDWDGWYETYEVFPVTVIRTEYRRHKEVTKIIDKEMNL